MRYFLFDTPSSLSNGKIKTYHFFCPQLIYNASINEITLTAPNTTQSAGACGMHATLKKPCRYP